MTRNYIFVVMLTAAIVMGSPEFQGREEIDSDSVIPEPALEQSSSASLEQPSLATRKGAADLAQRHSHIDYRVRRTHDQYSSKRYYRLKAYYRRRRPSYCRRFPLYKSRNARLGRSLMALKAKLDQRRSPKLASMHPLALAATESERTRYSRHGYPLRRGHRHRPYLKKNFRKLFRGVKKDNPRHLWTWVDPELARMVRLSRPARRKFERAVGRGRLSATVNGRKCCFGGQCVHHRSYTRMNDRAVRKGYDWMQKFVREVMPHKNLRFTYEVFVDATQDPGCDAAQRRIIRQAVRFVTHYRRAFKRRFMRKIRKDVGCGDSKHEIPKCLRKNFRKGSSPLPDILSWLNDDHVMGLKPDKKMLKLADALYKHYKDRGELDTVALGWDPKKHEHMVKEDTRRSAKYIRSFFDVQLLQQIWYLSNRIWKNRWPHTYNFIDSLKTVKNWRFPRYVGLNQPGRSTFEQTLYSATHLPIFMEFYEAGTMTRDEAAWLFRYMESVLARVISDRDVELTSEITDGLKMVGGTVFNSRYVCQAEMFLMHVQKYDGSFAEKEWVQQDWPGIKYVGHNKPGTYDAFHINWAAIPALQRHANPGHSAERWIRPIDAKVREQIMSKTGMQHHVGRVTSIRHDDRTFPRIRRRL